MLGRAKRLDPLKDNLYRREVDQATGERTVQKSCPKCSKKEGTVVFYPESDFGVHQTPTGRTQAYRDCSKHRKKLVPVG